MSRCQSCQAPRAPFFVGWHGAVFGRSHGSRAAITGQGCLLLNKILRAILSSLSERKEACSLPLIDDVSTLE